MINRVARATARVRTIADVSLGVLMAGLLLVAVVDVLWQVYTRYVRQDPASYTEELAGYLLVWIAIFGGAYAVGTRAHLAIDIVPGRARGWMGFAIEAAINSAVFAFALSVMTIGGWKLAQGTFAHGQVSAAMQFRVGWVYVGVPLAGGIMMFYAILNTVEKLVEVLSRHGRTKEI